MTGGYWKIFCVSLTVGSQGYGAWLYISDQHVLDQNTGIFVFEKGSSPISLI